MYRGIQIVQHAPAPSGFLLLSHKHIQLCARLHSQRNKGVWRRREESLCVLHPLPQHTRFRYTHGVSLPYERASQMIMGLSAPRRARHTLRARPRAHSGRRDATAACRLSRLSRGPSRASAHRDKTSNLGSRALPPPDPPPTGSNRPQTSTPRSSGVSHCGAFACAIPSICGSRSREMGRIATAEPDSSSSIRCRSRATSSLPGPSL